MPLPPGLSLPDAHPGAPEWPAPATFLVTPAGDAFSVSRLHTAPDDAQIPDAALSRRQAALRDEHFRLSMDLAAPCECPDPAQPGRRLRLSPLADPRGGLIGLLGHCVSVPEEVAPYAPSGAEGARKGPIDFADLVLRLSDELDPQGQWRLSFDEADLEADELQFSLALRGLLAAGMAQGRGALCLGLAAAGDDMIVLSLEAQELPPPDGLGVLSVLRRKGGTNVRPAARFTMSLPGKILWQDDGWAEAGWAS